MGEKRFAKVTVDIAPVEKHGYAVVLFNSPPVNTLSSELMTEIREAILYLESLPRCRGAILTSSRTGIFSAGLNLPEFLKPHDQVKKFWKCFQDLAIAMFSTRLVLVAAINGHAPAGGCFICLACDYRIMLKGKYIGLNETMIGLVAPKWFFPLMQSVIGERETQKALMLGTLYPSSEAARIGLVDELADNVDSMRSRAEEVMAQFLVPIESALVETKEYLNRQLTAFVRSQGEKEQTEVADVVAKSESRQTIMKYIKEIAENSKAKKSKL